MKEIDQSKRIIPVVVRYPVLSNPFVKSEYNKKMCDYMKILQFYSNNVAVFPDDNKLTIMVPELVNHPIMDMQNNWIKTSDCGEYNYGTGYTSADILIIFINNENEEPEFDRAILCYGVEPFPKRILTKDDYMKSTYSKPMMLNLEFRCHCIEDKFIDDMAKDYINRYKKFAIDMKGISASALIGTNRTKINKVKVRKRKDGKDNATV